MIEAKDVVVAEKKTGMIISQKKMAAYCLLMNCHLINVKKDLKNNFRAVFIFKDDDKLKKALEDCGAVVLVTREAIK
jgi:hypothetical protein